MTNALLADSRAGFGLLTFMLEKQSKVEVMLRNLMIRLNTRQKTLVFEQKWMMLIVEDYVDLK